MQRRNSARSQGLSRQKSSSSAKSVHLVHIHPDTAEHAAQSAAIQAFARARERSLNSTAQWPPPRSTERPVSKRHSNAFVASQNSTTLHRQQSVRFVQSKSSWARPRDDAVESTPSRKSNARSYAHRNPGQIQLQQNTFAAGIAFAAKGTAGDYINALITGEDYYTPEDDIASVPSSYRRLRKSKSMYAGPAFNKLGGEHHASGTALQSSKADNRNSDIGDHGNVGGRRLGAPRSMSFLRTRRRTSDTFVPRGPLPKHKLLDGDTPGSDHLHIKKAKSSGFLRPKQGRPEKLFRKTLRDVNSGTNSLGVKSSKDGSLRLKARKVSQNFKHKLKAFFNVSKENGEVVELPLQQIKAGKTHVIEKYDPIYGLDDSYLTAEDTESTTVSRVTSGIPALHAVPPELRLRSRRGSLESFRSEREVSDEKSRVTSWSDSDTKTYSTINSSRGEWDKQQLSVIKENGTRIISQDHKRPPIDPHSSAPVSNMLTPAKNVNGQRVYSALMKRLDKNGQRMMIVDDTRQNSVEDFVVHGKVPTRDSSNGCISVVKTKAATVRHVATHNIAETGLNGATSMATIIHDPEPHPAAYLTKNDILEGNGLEEKITSLPRNTLLPRDTQGIGSQNAATSLPRSLTSPELDRLAPSGRTLSERSSVFFGSPSCNLFRTQSPYRRAIRESMRAAAEGTPARSPEFNPWKKSLKSIRFRCPSTCESEDDRKMTYEESVYSTDGVEVSNVTSCSPTFVDKFPSPPENHGDATIFLGPTKYATPTSKPAERIASSASSVEWKQWLSANLSALDQSCTPPDKYDAGKEGAGTLRLPSITGHVRENAQIEGEQDSAIVTSGFQGNTSSSPSTCQGLANASPVLTQNTLRSTLSLANLGSRKENINTSREQAGKSAINSAQPKPLFHARSLDALGTQDQNVATPKVRLARKLSSSKLHALQLSTPMMGIRAQRQIAAKSSGVNELNRCHSNTPGKMKSENISPRVADQYESHVLRTPGLHGPEGSSNRLSMASKHMVELFLDSRRRRIAGTDDTDAFL